MSISDQKIKDDEMLERFANIADIYALNPITKESVEIFEIPLHDVVERISDRIDYSFLCKGIKIKNFYKFPNKVVNFAKSLRYTDSYFLTTSAPVIRTNTFIHANVQKILQEVIEKNFNRNLIPSDANSSEFGYTSFSFTLSNTQSILKNLPPHCDALPYDTGLFNWALHEPENPDLIFPVLVYLTDSPNQGTGFFRYKYEYLWRSTSPYMPYNGAVHSRRLDHLEKIYFVENEFNTLVGYYGAIPHTALYPTFEEGYGRLVQHIDFQDSLDK